jgi:hypothetical protein
MERDLLQKAVAERGGWGVTGPAPVPAVTVSALLAGKRFLTSRVPRAVIYPAPGAVRK